MQMKRSSTWKQSPGPKVISSTSWEKKNSKNEQNALVSKEIFFQAKFGHVPLSSNDSIFSAKDQ